MANQTTSTAMKDLQGFFKDGERERIYRQAEKVRDMLLIRLLWKSGRRISEVLEVKVVDIDFENKLIYWNILKKKEPLRVMKPIDNVTLQTIRYYLNNTPLLPEHYLLHGGNPTKHISRQRCDQIIKRLCKKAGIFQVGNKKPHAHHFRHSFCIDIVKEADKEKMGASGIRIVQQALEHSSLKMTEQYLQFAPEELRRLIKE